MKTCTKCGVARPFSEYSAYKAAPDGLRPRCRECRRQDEREYYRRGGRERANAKYHRDPVAAATRERERRQRLRKPKPTPTPQQLSEKAERALRLKRDARKRTYEKNKVKVLATAAKYRALHLAEESKNRKAHYQRNKERVREIAKAYRLANLDMYARCGAKRRAARRNALVSWADPVKIAAIYAEAARMTEETGIPHEVDHFYPLLGKTVCGLHCEANLRVVTREENRSKGHKHPDVPGFDA